jgi:hypothetical protein
MTGFNLNLEGIDRLIDLFWLNIRMWRAKMISYGRETQPEPSNFQN